MGAASVRPLTRVAQPSASQRKARPLPTSVGGRLSPSCSRQRASSKLEPRPASADRAPSAPRRNQLGAAADQHIGPTSGRRQHQAERDGDDAEQAPARAPQRAPQSASHHRHEGVGRDRRQTPDGSRQCGDHCRAPCHGIDADAHHPQRRRLAFCADRDGSLAAFLKPGLLPPERRLAQVEGWILGVLGLSRMG
jgi:hypothetical protein